MKLLIFSSLLIATLALPTEPPGGNLCKYTPVGDESTQDAVPIADFRTSGQDFIRFWIFLGSLEVPNMFQKLWDFFLIFSQFLKFFPNFFMSKNWKKISRVPRGP